MAKLEVQIGADVNDLVKKLDTADKKLKGLGNSVEKAGKKVAPAIGNMTKSVGNAVPAVTEFSRVIQDAPYGIQGVANNIQQLTGQFGYLSKATGGTVPALKSMLGALTGPTGILLAVSVVTSVMVKYGDEILKASDSTAELSKAMAENVGKVKAEISAFEQLLEIANNENNSKKLRLGALDEINQKYSKYLGNLDLESLKTDKVKNSVISLTNSLILKAKADGLQSLITEKTTDASEDIISAELRRKDALKRLNSEILKTISNNSYFNTVLGNKAPKDRIKSFIDLTKKQNDVGQSARQAIGFSLNAFRSANQEVKDLNSELNKSLAPLVNLQNQYKEGFIVERASVENIDSNAVIIKVEADSDEAGRKVGNFAKSKTKLFDQIAKDQIQADERAVDEFIKMWENVDIDIDGFDGDYENIQRGFEGIVKEGEKIKELQKILNSLDIDDVNLEGLGIEKLEQFENSLKRSIEAADIFSSAVSSSIGALVNEMSSNFETGNVVLDAFVGSILQSLAQIAAAALTSLITEKIIGVAKNEVNRSVSSANAITIATSAAAALGPAGVIALPGLIASQLAVVNGAFAAAGSFALGGFSGDDNLAWLNRNELILRPMEQAALYNMIRGGYSSGNISADTNSSGSSEIMGNVILRGQNQYIQLRRAERQMKRKFNS